MLTLAFDTATDVATVALVRDGDVLGERASRAYLTADEGEPAEAIVYCPRCATREFGAARFVDASL